MPSSPTGTKLPCAVCGDVGDGVHFGAQACRACAAFFRRSIAMSKNYICRHDANCPIQSNIRCLCRACRFEKCNAVGMRKTAVQQGRDSIGSRQQHEPTPPLQKSPSPGYQEEPSTSAHLPRLPSESTPLLTRMEEHFTKLEKIRKIIHWPKEENVFKTRVPRPILYQEAHEIHMKELHLVSDWVITAFPEYEGLDLDQKRILFHNFYIPFSFLEGGYTCVKTGRTDIIVKPSGDYIDCMKPEMFYSKINDGTLISNEDAVRLFGSSCALYQRNVIFPIFEHKMTRTEFFASICFVLWDRGIIGQTRECEELAMKIRAQMTKELLYYYKYEAKVEDPALRVSSLLMILPLVHRMVRRCQEDMEMSRVFNVFPLENSYCGFVLGRHPIDLTSYYDDLNIFKPKYNGLPDDVKMKLEQTEREERKSEIDVKLGTD